jgi:nitric oxide reductase subunit B
MLIATAALFTVGVALFIFDFFRHAPKFEILSDEDPNRRIDMPATPSSERYA